VQAISGCHLEARGLLIHTACQLLSHGANANAAFGTKLALRTTWTQGPAD